MRQSFDLGWILTTSAFCPSSIIYFRSMEPEAEVIMSMGPTLHSLSAIDFHKDISKEVLDCTAQLKDLDINSSAADRYNLRELE